MPLTPLDLPALNPNESAYAVDSGDTIVVTTTQYSPPNDPAWLVLQLDVDVIDPVTMETIYAGLVSHPWTIAKAALAGTTTIEDEQARAHEKVADLALAGLAEIRAVDALPATETPGVPVTRDRSLASRTT